MPGARPPPPEGTGREPLWRTVLPLVAIVLVVGALTEWWQSRHQAELGRQAAAAVAARELMMLSSTTCGVCAHARQWLQTHGVPFRECFIDTDPGCRERFDAMGGVGTPIFVFGQRQLVGFEPNRLSSWLSAAPAGRQP